MIDGLFETLETNDWGVILDKKRTNQSIVPAKDLLLYHRYNKNLKGPAFVKVVSGISIEYQVSHSFHMFEVGRSRRGLIFPNFGHHFLVCELEFANEKTAIWSCLRRSAGGGGNSGSNPANQSPPFEAAT